jgi:hypothetical protein
MTARLHNYAEVGLSRRRASGLASGSNSAPHQRANRLLASESLGRLVCERRDAELRQHL